MHLRAIILNTENWKFLFFEVFDFDCLKRWNMFVGWQSHWRKLFQFWRATVYGQSEVQRQFHNLIKKKNYFNHTSCDVKIHGVTDTLSNSIPNQKTIIPLVGKSCFRYKKKRTRKRVISFKKFWFADAKEINSIFAVLPFYFLRCRYWWNQRLDSWFRSTTNLWIHWYLNNRDVCKKKKDA